MISEEIQQRLLYNEGFRPTPYYCTKGRQTIGIGHNIDANPITKEDEKVIGEFWYKDGITKNAAFYLLRKDVNRVIEELNNNVPWWNNLNNDRQYVMIDLCFQLGINGLMQFKKTLQYISTGFYIQASEELLRSKYAQQTPNRAKRNADCLRTGKYIL